MFLKKTGKKKFIIVICLVTVSILGFVLTNRYRNLEPYGKDMVKRFIRRITTTRTVSDFKYITNGTVLDEILKKNGEADFVNHDQFINTYQYYLFAGNSIEITIHKDDGKNSGVWYHYDGMTINGSTFHGFELLSDCYRHKWMNKDGKSAKEKTENRLPTSGDELPYDSDEWLKIYSATSSYNYALNIKRNLKTGKLYSDYSKRPIGLQPGEMSNSFLKNSVIDKINC